MVKYASQLDQKMHYSILCNVFLLKEKRTWPSTGASVKLLCFNQIQGLAVLEQSDLILPLSLQQKHLVCIFSQQLILNVLLSVETLVCPRSLMFIPLPLFPPLSISLSLTCSLCMHINEMWLVSLCLKVVYPNVGGSCGFTGLLITYSG